MKNFKNIAIAAALLFGASTAVVAQETKDNKEDFYPYWFVGVQGGAQVTFADFNIGKLITPQVAVQFGRWFCPQFGARVHVMGWSAKGVFQNGMYSDFGVDEIGDQTYTFKAFTGDMDFMFNMTNICWPNRKSQKFNWNLIAGWGVNFTWDYDEYNTLANYYSPYYSNPVRAKKNTTFNGRLATQFEYNVARNWAVNLELQANYKNDLFNLRVKDNMDWQAVALLGVTYKFGLPKKKVVEKAVVEPVYETRIDTTWYDDVTYKTVPDPDQQSNQSIKFAIRQSDPTGAPEIAQVADFVKSHSDAKVTVTGYADKGTGTPKINMKYSQKRAESVTKALVAAGVPADIITTDWKGDTVQPFPNNDDNRCTITVATGTGTKQEKVVTKKFRTKETQVPVNQ